MRYLQLASVAADVIARSVPNTCSVSTSLTTSKSGTYVRSEMVVSREILRDGFYGFGQKYAAFGLNYGNKKYLGGGHRREGVG